MLYPSGRSITISPEQSMEYNFEQAWLQTLEARFGVTAKIAQVALDDRPRMLIYYFENFPAKDMLTAVTAGLSNASHPDWQAGKPELCFSLQTRDTGWGSAAAYIPLPGVVQAGCADVRRQRHERLFRLPPAVYE
jgi:hypothetical protein